MSNVAIGGRWKIEVWGGEEMEDGSFEGTSTFWQTTLGVSRNPLLDRVSWDMLLRANKGRNGQMIFPDNRRSSDL